MAWMHRVQALTANLGRQPTLDELLAEAAGYKMTEAERVVQRRSWAIGNLALDRPEEPIEEIARRVDAAIAEGY